MFSGQWLMNYFIQTYHITMFILCDFMWFYVYNQKCDPIEIPGYPLVNKHSYWKWPSRNSWFSIVFCMFTGG